MLQIENELETSIESNYNQNNHDNFQNPDNIQEKMDDFEQKLDGSSSTHKIYQNASNKIQQSNEKVWTIPLILESPKKKKEKFSITRPHNWCFNRLKSRIKYYKHSHQE